MSDQLNKGKGFLKDKLGAYQVDPPESVWNSISAILGGGGRRRVYVMVLAMAASIALAITLGITFFRPDRQVTATIVKSEVQPSETSGSSQQEAVPQSQIKPGSISEDDARLSKTDIPAGRTNLRVKVTEVMEQIDQEKPTVEPVAQNFYVTDIKEGTAINDAVGLSTLSLDSMKTDEPADTTIKLTLNAGGDLPYGMDPFDQSPDKDPQWRVGALLSPLYSFRDAEGQAMAGGAEYETGLISYSGGINVSYRRGKRLAIESGIHFNKMGISIGAPGIQIFDQSFEFAPAQMDGSKSQMIAITNSVGNIVTESGQVVVNGYKLNARYDQNALFDSEIAINVQIAEQGIQQHLDYLELPINLRYTLVDRTFELQLVGGVSTNFLVNNYVTMETASGPTDIGYLTNINNVNYSGNAGLGMIYHLGERFSLLMEPRFKYFLNSVNDVTLPSTRPYALALYTGISFTF